MMDPTTFGQLVDEHAAGLALYARQWCAVPEDVVQEAFLRLVRQNKAPDTPVPWLYRVVRNLAISALRAAERRKKHEHIAAQRHVDWFLPKEFSALDGQSAAQALRGLPQEEREAITLHLWGGLTFVEVAEVLGSVSSTVHRWYTAGLNRLRERLGVTCPKKT